MLVVEEGLVSEQEHSVLSGSYLKTGRPESLSMHWREHVKEHVRASGPEVGLGSRTTVLAR